MPQLMLRTLLGLTLIILIISCGSQDEKSLVDVSQPESNLPAAPLPSADPTTNTSVAVPIPAEQIPSGSTPATNPPHGQPGHRCDLSVGAPLPAAAPASASPVVATPASTSNANPTPNVPKLNLPGVSAGRTSSAKLNPEHGQPGHRCDLAVGAPLPDAVSQPTQSLTTTNNRLSNNPAPVLNLPASNAGIKLNPAHGQPGHRCDIAVGAPLK